MQSESNMTPAHSKSSITSFVPQNQRNTSWLIKIYFLYSGLIEVELQALARVKLLLNSDR